VFVPAAPHYLQPPAIAWYNSAMSLSTAGRTAMDICQCDSHHTSEHAAATSLRRRPLWKTCFGLGLAPSEQATDRALLPCDKEIRRDSDRAICPYNHAY
jgi:hypothetical protein